MLAILAVHAILLILIAVFISLVVLLLTPEERKITMEPACSDVRSRSALERAGKLAALKVASLRGVSKGKRVILLDQNGGSAKALAKALAKQGFSQVFIVEGGYNGWSRAGLATTARGR